nr:MAG TPA: hypothetical protein [Caudoviricetes sp.]
MPLRGSESVSKGLSSCLGHRCAGKRSQCLKKALRA